MLNSEHFAYNSVNPDEHMAKWTRLRVCKAREIKSLDDFGVFLEINPKKDYE